MNKPDQFLNGLLCGACCMAVISMTAAMIAESVVLVFVFLVFSEALVVVGVIERDYRERRHLERDTP